jgi:cobalamin-dependent methionine synthase I
MMVMIETVQRGYVQDAMPDIEVMKKFMEDDGKLGICEQEISELREIRSREGKRDPELRKPSVRGPIRHRRSRRKNLDEIYRMPSLFTWRC